MFFACSENAGDELAHALCAYTSFFALFTISFYTKAFVEADYCFFYLDLHFPCAYALTRVTCHASGQVLLMRSHCSAHIIYPSNLCIYSLALQLNHGIRLTSEPRHPYESRVTQAVTHRGQTAPHSQVLQHSIQSQHSFLIADHIACLLSSASYILALKSRVTLAVTI